MIERVFALNQRRVDPAMVERHHEVFVAHYTAGIPGRSRPYPGVLEAIARAARSRLHLRHLHQQAGRHGA